MYRAPAIKSSRSSRRDTHRDINVQEKALEAAEKRRAETEIPTEPAMLVEFFLNCSAEDIEYFIAKTKDQLDNHFFAALDSAIGRQRCDSSRNPTWQFSEVFMSLRTLLHVLASQCEYASLKRCNNLNTSLVKIATDVTSSDIIEFRSSSQILLPLPRACFPVVLSQCMVIACTTHI